MIGIYKITNKQNGKAYIGQSVNIKKRWEEHKYSDKSDSLIHRAIKKYGIDSFCFEVLCECEKSELNELEVKYISEHGTMHPNGYNLKSGGGQGIEYSEASKKKMSESMKGRSGWRHSEETKKKIGDALRGRKRPKEVVEKTRLALIGRPLSEEHKEKLRDANRGRYFSQETREKIGSAHRGKKKGPLSEEQRARLSQSLKGINAGENNPAKRPEVRAKISEKAKGRKPSEETRRKLSEAHRNISDETRAKMSASHKGKSMPKYPWRYPDGHIVYMPNNISARFVREGKGIVRVQDEEK